MIVVGLELENFERFDKLKINFPTEGLIGIFGPNEAGKSSICDAVCYALFGRTTVSEKKTVKKIDRILNWNIEEDHGFVKLIFKAGDKIYRVERYFYAKKPDRAKLFHRTEKGWEEFEKTTSIKRVSKNIAKIIGMDFYAFRNTAFIAQKELDQLVKLTRGDRSAIINLMLNLEDFDTAMAILNDDRKETADILGRIKDYLEEAVDLERLRKLIEEINIFKLAKDKYKRVRGIGKVKAGLKKYEKKTDKSEGRKEDLKKEEQKLPPDVSQKIESLKNGIKNYKRKETLLYAITVLLLIGAVAFAMQAATFFVIGMIIFALTSIAYSRINFAPKRAQLEKQLPDLQVQQGNREDGLRRIKGIREEIQKLQESANKLWVAIGEKCKGIDEELGEMFTKRKVEEILGRVDKISEAKGEVKAKINRAKQEMKELAEKLDIKLRRDPTSQIEDLNQKLEKKQKAAEEMLDDLAKRLKVKPEKIDKEIKKALEDEIDLIKITRELIKETVNDVHERIRPLVSQNIRTYLPLVTQDRYDVVDFDEDYKVQVEIPQTGKMRTLDFLSGGTQDQIYLCTRLAFTKTITPEKAIILPQTLFIDEPLGSSDEMRRRGILTLLREVKESFPQIFLITHISLGEPDIDYALELELDENDCGRIVGKTW